MASEFVETQGTEIFLLPDGETTPMVMACPTAATKSGGARNMIEIMCLNAIDPEFRSGTRTPTTWSIPFALIPTEASHQVLFDLADSGTPTPFLIALSDGTADPTVTTGALTAPAGRTSFGFTAIVMDVAIDIATNEVVRGTLTLQVSGPITRTWKVPV